MKLDVPITFLALFITACHGGPPTPIHSGDQLLVEGSTPGVTPFPPPTASPAPAPVLAAMGPLPPPRPARISDLHVDTISRILNENLSGIDDPHLESSLTELEAGDVGLIVEAVWVPAPKHVPDPWAYTHRVLDALHQELARFPLRWGLITSATDMPLFDRDHRVAALLSLEGGHALQSVEDVSTLKNRGISMIGLTWSYSNTLCGSSGDQPIPGTGLTPFGADIVREMNRLGIAIDVSHSSDTCLSDVLKLSTRPVIASHSNARALKPLHRNLSDESLRAIGAGGGLVGVMFHTPFLGGQDGVTLDDVVDEIFYMASVMGWEAVAIGSDFDGRISAPQGLTRASDLPRLRQALMTRGATPGQVDAVMGGNLLRYLERVELPSDIP